MGGIRDIVYGYDLRLGDGYCKGYGDTGIVGETY